MFRILCKCTSRYPFKDLSGAIKGVGRKIFRGGGQRKKDQQQKSPKNSTIEPLPGGGGGNRKKKSKKHRKISLFSLSLLYFYHV